MTIHKEGKATLLIGFFVCTGISALAHYFLGKNVSTYIITSFCLLIFLVLLQFFRKPSRSFSEIDGEVICPADGKVVVIEEVEETEYFKDKRIQVSVFMSPFNVHINWFPISGIVKYVKYHPGLFLVAWHPKSSTDNERTTVVVESKNKVEVLFRQIAGALAKRIVCYPEANQPAKAGEEFGFIKFGSRVDIFLPIGTDIKVKLDQKVVGKKTVLAKLN